MWFTFTWRPFWFYGFLRRGNLVQLAKCVDFCFRFFLISAYFIHINSCICAPKQQTFRQQINKIIFWMDFTPAIDTFEILKFFFTTRSWQKLYLYLLWIFVEHTHARTLTFRDSPNKLTAKYCPMYAAETTVCDLLCLQFMNYSMINWIKQIISNEFRAENPS